MLDIGIIVLLAIDILLLSIGKIVFLNKAIRVTFKIMKDKLTESEGLKQDEQIETEDELTVITTRPVLRLHRYIGIIPLIP